MCRRIAGALLATLLTACIDRNSAQKAIESIQEAAGVKPDTMPVMLNTDPPFRYPRSLYDRKVQGNVTLHVHIDSTGVLVPESTQVVESSGYPALDSAAVQGAQELRFKPAKLRGGPVAVSILLPVFFRHPGSRPLPGDTILHHAAPATPAAPAATHTP